MVRQMWALPLHILLLSITMDAVSTLKIRPSFVLGISKAMRVLDDQTDFNQYQNCFLHGMFAPVTEENFNVPTSIISGSIPDDMNGLFLRIGPNPIVNHPHTSNGYHLFDGHGMIHSIRLQKGQAVYSNQWIQTPNYRLSRQHNQVVFPQLGEIKGAMGLFKVLVLDPMLSMAFNQTDVYHGTANTALLLYRDRLYACHERSLPFEIKWQGNNSFASLGFEDFGGAMHYPMTAHPKISSDGETLYFNGYSAHDSQPAMVYGEICRHNVARYLNITSPHRTFAHDMISTENYSIIPEPSIVFDKRGILSGHCFRFSNHSMRVAVIPKRPHPSRSLQEKEEVEVEWFTLPKPLASMHILNAWEESDEILLHLLVSHDFNGLNPSSSFSSEEASLSITPSRTSAKTMMAEVRLNLLTRQTQLKYYRDRPASAPFNPLSFLSSRFNNDKKKSSNRLKGEEMSIEFPTLHPRYMGRKCRFGFAGISTDIGMSHIGKFDMYNRRLHSVIALPRDLRCGEPVVVVKAGKRGEGSDSVYLASFATNLRDNSSEFIAYDGESMSQEPVLRLRLGKGLRVPFGFHGLFIPQHSLDGHMKYSDAVLQV